jgi:hypothetical protein
MLVGSKLLNAGWGNLFWGPCRPASLLVPIHLGPTIYFPGGCREWPPPGYHCQCPSYQPPLQ